jgi:hypothetical protein
MERPESLGTGRGLFLVASGFTLVTEGLLAVAAAALFGDLALLLTGVVRVGILALLAKWAYTGSWRGKVATLAWVGLHVAVTAGALLVAMVVPHWFRGVPSKLLEVGRVLPAVRVCVLSAFGLLLLRSRGVSAFLEGQRGKAAPAMTPAAYALLGVSIVSVVAWVILAAVGLTFSWRDFGP